MAISQTCVGVVWMREIGKNGRAYRAGEGKFWEDYVWDKKTNGWATMWRWARQFVTLRREMIMLKQPWYGWVSIKLLLWWSRHHVTEMILLGGLLRAGIYFEVQISDWVEKWNYIRLEWVKYRMVEVDSEMVICLGGNNIKILSKNWLKLNKRTVWKNLWNNLSFSHHKFSVYPKEQYFGLSIGWFTSWNKH